MGVQPTRSSRDALLISAAERGRQRRRPRTDWEHQWEHQGVGHPTDPPPPTQSDQWRSLWPTWPSMPLASPAKTVLNCWHSSHPRRVCDGGWLWWGRLGATHHCPHPIPQDEPYGYSLPRKGQRGPVTPTGCGIASRFAAVAGSLQIGLRGPTRPSLIATPPLTLRIHVS